MFQNRFKDVQSEEQASRTSSGFAFFPFPSSNSAPAQGNWWSLLYQAAFEGARETVMAEKRREAFAASLN
jgi:hypothetical protein